MYYDNELLNPELIFEEEYKLKFYLINNFKREKDDIKIEKEDLTFEKIEDYKELIFPTYYQ